MGRALVIDRFVGEHSFLSNFHVGPIVMDGGTYRSGEHAFSAGKTLDPTEAAWVMSAGSPGEAKRRGRRVTLRPGWDAAIRFDVMRSVIAAKFATDPLRSRLLATGDALLVEGTTWHDQVWGDCTCPKHRAWPGANHLGQMLMAERAAIRHDPPDRWVRVALTGHRSLSVDEYGFAEQELIRLAAKLRDEHGTTTAISGMAVGADTLWADTALQAGLQLWAYIPFPQQEADRRWTHEDRAHWAHLRSRAEREVVLGTGYDVRLLHARNDAMLRDSDLLIAVCDPSRTAGGTAATLEKARQAGKPVVVVDVSRRRTTHKRGPRTATSSPGDQ
jgi:ribA/ribD-fused uncharacterized protein